MRLKSVRMKVFLPTASAPTPYAPSLMLSRHWDARRFSFSFPCRVWLVN